MNFQTALSSINWIAIIIVTLISFILGALWYSKLLFGKIWSAEVNPNPGEEKKVNFIKIFGLSFVFNLITVFALYHIVGLHSTLWAGFFKGLFVGIALVAAPVGTIYLFAGRSFRLFIIDALYYIVYCSIAGIIFGAW